MSSKSTFLFADPSFIYGLAHILDFEGTFDVYNQSLTPAEADARALYSDWSAVGDELNEALKQLAAA